MVTLRKIDHLFKRLQLSTIMTDKQPIVDRILYQLKVQVLNLIDDLLTIFPDEPDILLIRLYFENQVDPITLMNGFVKWVYPWKNHIKNRNEDFFKKNDHIFGPLPTDKVYYFKRRVEDGTLDKEDKDTMWKYFDLFIKLIDKYNKVK